MTDNNIEPMAPEIVFFGLILVSFGPLNNFPNKKPPISEATQVNRIKKAPKRGKNIMKDNNGKSKNMYHPITIRKDIIPIRPISITKA